MSHDDFLRIEKGRAEPEELAALTAVLLAHAAAGRTHPRPTRTSTTRWHRSQHQPYYHAPHSWQSGT